MIGRGAVTTYAEFHRTNAVRNQSRSDRNQSFSAGTIPKRPESISFRSETLLRCSDWGSNGMLSCRNVPLSTAQCPLAFTREVISYPFLNDQRSADGLTRQTHDLSKRAPVRWLDKIETLAPGVREIAAEEWGNQETPPYGRAFPPPGDQSVADLPRRGGRCGFRLAFKRFSRCQAGCGHTSPVAGEVGDALIAGWGVGLHNSITLTITPDAKVSRSFGNYWLNRKPLLLSSAQMMFS